MKNKDNEMRNRIVIGDNREVLASDAIADCRGHVKVIYIDPPYNTKTCKSYRDTQESDEWLETISATIAEGRGYLSRDGVMFISIDDNEYASLKVACDGIFGRQNYVGTFITRQAQRSNAKLINVVHEYVMCYAMDKPMVKDFCIRRLDVPDDAKMMGALHDKVAKAFLIGGRDAAQETLAAENSKICEEEGITWLRNYNLVDDDGRIFYAKDLSTPGSPREVDIPSIGLHLKPLASRGWSSDKRFIDLHGQGRLAYKAGRPYCKQYLSEAEDNAPSILNFYSRQGTNDLNRLGLRGLFDTPKPVGLIKFLIRLCASGDDIVLDFYGGSGTTAQAVYELNAETGSDLRYVLIQRNEAVNEKSEIYRNCLRYNIRTTVPSILLKRIDTYLEKNGKAADYDVVEYDMKPVGGGE